MTLEPGLQAAFRHTVTEADTAAAIGSGGVPVLATPRVLALAERATVAAVAGALQAGGDHGWDPGRAGLSDPSLVETFETAVTWDRLDELDDRVTEATRAALAEVYGAGTVPASSPTSTRAAPPPISPCWPPLGGAANSCMCSRAPLSFMAGLVVAR